MSSEPAKQNKLVERLKFIAKFVFAFGIIAYMIYTDRLDLAVVRKGLFNPMLMFASFGLIFFGMLISFFRWSRLLAGQNVEMPFIKVLRYGFIGVFFNTTMPGIVSGDVVKGWYVVAGRKEGQDKTPILMSILIDRLVGLFGLISVSIIALMANWSSVWSSVKLAAVAKYNVLLALAVVFFYVLVFLSAWGPFAYARKKLERWSDNKFVKVFLKVYDAFAHYRSRMKTLVLALGTAVATHSCTVTAIFLCALAIGETQLHAYQVFLVAPLGLLATAIPISPAGLGVGHVVFAGLFATVGSNMGAEIFTLFITLQILNNLLGVFFYIKTPKPKRMQAGAEASLAV